jgi:hypothetical protein
LPIGHAFSINVYNNNNIEAVMTTNLQFCYECGNLLEKGKICKKCTFFLSKGGKDSANVAAEQYRKAPQRFLNKNVHMPAKQQINPTNTNRSSNITVRHRARTVARYSVERGLEVGWDLETPERLMTKAVFCIKCHKVRANWEGLWIVPGGKGRSLDPEVRTKRVFLCGICWSPFKHRSRIELEELGINETQLFNPL